MDVNTDQHDAKAAEALLREWTAGESLVKHGLGVAACTESYGRREAARLGLSGEDAARMADTYRAAGLLHDLDYERHPSLEEHPFACDELAGFLTACALVKPSRAIAEVEVSGVRKKMKDKAFARAVKREDITRGAELLGIPLDEHIGHCVAAMQARAAELGL